MISLLLSAFLAQTLPAETPAAERIVLDPITFHVPPPNPDVTILLTMQEIDLTEESEMKASFVDKIPESID
jgi:hypothetical protein